EGRAAVFAGERLGVTPLDQERGQRRQPDVAQTGDEGNTDLALRTIVRPGGEAVPRVIRQPDLQILARRHLTRLRVSPLAQPVQQPRQLLLGVLLRSLDAVPLLPALAARVAAQVDHDGPRFVTAAPDV